LDILQKNIQDNRQDNRQETSNRLDNQQDISVEYLNQNIQSEYYDIQLGYPAEYFLTISEKISELHKIL
jgi:hypothetical protein